MMDKVSIMSAMDEYADQGLADMADMRASVLSQVRELKAMGSSQASAQQSYAPSTVAASAITPTPEAPTRASVQKTPQPPAARQRKFAKLAILGWSPAVAATLILIVGCIVAGLLVVVNSPVRTQQSTNLLPNSGFEEGLGSWSFRVGGGLAGYGPMGRTNDYTATISTQAYHSGTASAVISATLSASYDEGVLQTSMPAAGLTGKRIMFSGYVKTEGERTAAILSIDFVGTLTPEQHAARLEIGDTSEADQKYPIGGDSLSDRPILGTTDWTRYDMVVDVPANATDIQLYLFMKGPGKVWLDDLQLVEVGNDVATTDDSENLAPVNPGFEQGLTGWNRIFDTLSDFSVGIDTSIYHSGKASGVITSYSTDPSSLASFVLTQKIDPKNYFGQRVRFSAYIKTENLSEEAQLMLGDTDIMGEMRATKYSMEVRGTTDWQLVEVEADAPKDGHYIFLQLGVRGIGTVWIDDVQLESIGKIKPPTPTPAP